MRLRIVVLISLFILEGLAWAALQTPVTSVFLDVTAGEGEMALPWGGINVISVGMDVCGDIPHVVWLEADEAGDTILWHSYRNDTGWVPPTALPTEGAVNSNVSVACYADTLHVVWVEESAGL